MAKKVLKQRAGYDCGVACLAMLLGETYKEVRRATDHYLKTARKQKLRDTGMDEDDDRAVAKAFGKKLKVWYPGKTKARRKEIVKRLCGRPAILTVPALGYPPGTEFHAVYWDGKHVHDPDPTCPVSRFGKNGRRALARFINAVVL